MEQLKRLLATLSIRQRLTIAAAAAVVVLALFGFSRWKRENDFRPLYTALAAEDAGAVVQKLKESGVEYRLSENGAAVLVPSAKLAELRLELAAAGLPKSGRIGFELFDKTNLGATDFTEHINYRRALEGELERSVMSLAAVEQARVHVTFPKDSVFLESRQAAKASVMLRLRPGAMLSPQNVIAVSHLIASAVEGLAPEAVSILDMRGNLLSRIQKAAAIDGPEPSEAVLEYRHNIEKDLLAKINSTLEPLLGAEKFRAGVSIECDFSSGEQSEETFDPTRSVMVTSQKTEDINGAGGASGIPGTASNLPRPTSRPGSTMAGMSRRTESIAYQSSRTVRKMRLPQGSIKRMSVSVLVDQGVRWEGAGAKMQRVLVPPAPERMKTIRDVIAGATGFVQERGDQLVVESLPFESTLNPEPAGPPAGSTPSMPGLSWQRIWDSKQIIFRTLGAVGLLLLVCWIAFLRFRKKNAGANVHLPSTLPAGTDRAESGQLTSLSPSELEHQMAKQLEENAALQAKMEAEALSSLKLPTVTTKKTAVLSKHLRDTVQKDPPGTTRVLRGWMTAEER